MTYKNIVVLTGAGVSAESGIRTFRDNDGLWENHRLEDVATPKAFHRDPDLVYRFYNERRKQLLQPDIKPNLAHIALALLEKQHDGDVTIVTQNVDNLHERAGSENIIHMHGELLAARCSVSEEVMPWESSFDGKDKCSCCDPANNIRPHIVWFGEMPLEMMEIQRLLHHADLFLSIGTSGNVYPAAGFVAEANIAGAHTVELNLQPSVTQNNFAEHHYGPASEVVPRYLKEVLNIEL